MGKRQDIYDASATALEASTTINRVSQDMMDDPFASRESSFPLVRLTDGTETKVRLAFPHPTADDMESELELNWIGYVRSLNKSSSELRDEQDAVQVAVELALTGSTAVADLVKDITANTVSSDRGNSEGIAWVSGTYDVLYHYNHLVP